MTQPFLLLLTGSKQSWQSTKGWGLCPGIRGDLTGTASMSRTVWGKTKTNRTTWHHRGWYWYHLISIRTYTYWYPMVLWCSCKFYSSEKKRSQAIQDCYDLSHWVLDISLKFKKVSSSFLFVQLSNWMVRGILWEVKPAANRAEHSDTWLYGTDPWLDVDWL